MTRHPVRRWPGAAAALAMTALAACATNPVTGETQFSLMSEQQEIQVGRDMDGEIRREMGLYADTELQQYVAEVGRRLAAQSHRPGLPWHFAVVDQPAVNAFALPGGYIYLTRGILPFLDSEAELAGVLGHEIGHVTARHAAEAYTKATSAGVGLTVLSIFVPAARPAQGLAETAFGLLFLKHGRDDERQSDRLGVEYAAKAGWDPAGVAGMLTTLSRLDEASTSSRGVPGWLSTHPDPADRVQTVQPIVRQAAAGRTGDPFVTNRDGFLRRLDGLVFGDHPEQGVVRAGEFLHAGLKFALTFPGGWDVTNTETQVIAQLPGEEVYLLLQLVPQPRGRLEDIAVEGMRGAGYRLVEGARTQIGGLPAFQGTYRGRRDGVGVVLAEAAHIEYGRNVFLLVGLAPERTYDRVRSDFTGSIRSFRTLSAPDAARIQPNRLDFYTVRPGDTWQAIAARAGEGIVKASTLAIMNHYPVNEQPRAGERIKVVVGG